jgi:hypothetical protein
MNQSSHPGIVVDILVRVYIRAAINDVEKMVRIHPTRFSVKR